MVLHSPLGPRDGLLTLREARGTITGTLCILFHELPVSGSRRADGRLHLIHRIVTSVGEYPCRSILQEAGTALTGELQMDQAGAPWSCGSCQPKAVMAWSGEQLNETEEERI